MPVNYIDGATIKGTSYDLHDPRTDHKAEIDGSYADLTAGNAEQLVSTVGVTDKVPYAFRTSGGSADIGDREEDVVVGGSVVWNQLADQTEAVTKSFETDTATYHGSIGSLEESVRVIETHKYFVAGIVTRTISGNNAINIQIANNSGPRIAVANGAQNGWNATISQSAITYSSNDIRYNNYSGKKGFSAGDSISVDKLICIDLTQMFGSTIADYLHTLETSTPGAGVAWFKKLFPKSYYAYDAGTLMHVQTSAHNMVGFNAYDSATGKAQLVGGMEYQITGAYTALTFNGETITPDVNGKFTPATNGELTVTGGNGTTTCVHLVLDGERDGEYESYELHSYELDSSLTLRGIPKLDSNNALYYDGDVYAPDGTVTRKYGIVDLGTLTWTYNSGSAFFKATVTGKLYGNKNIVCGKYAVSSSVTAGNMVDKEIKGYPNDDSDRNAIYVKDSAYTDAATFKTAMSGVMLVYELATPTTETADPYQTPQVVNNWGTEQYVDAGTRDVEIPVGHETLYRNDLRAKLESAPESPDGNGDYIVRQTNGVNSYVPLVIPAELPSNPSEDGTYVLKATVSDGTTVLSWVAQE